MKTEVAVVIPYYHYELTATEKISLQNCIDVLGHYPIVLVVPESMEKENYPQVPDLLYEVVPDAWLRSVEAYNRMMLLEEFYRRFLHYEYILIFQLDAFVFSDLLKRFCDYRYDYIGAPWLQGMYYMHNLHKCMWYVGNGGFSLRKVSSFINILRTCCTDNIKVHEDIFWASRESEQFHVAPAEIALQFAFEDYVRQCYSLNQCQLPFGCHAWEKYDFEFWKPIFAERGYHPISQTTEEIDVNKVCLTPFFHYLNADQTLIRDCLDRMLRGRKTIYIFGAGRRGKECVWLLRHVGVGNIRCIDNNAAVWGSKLWDIVIEAPDILKSEEKGSVLVLIAVKYAEKEILHQLQEWKLVYGSEVFFYRELTEDISSSLESVSKDKEILGYNIAAN